MTSAFPPVPIQARLNVLATSDLHMHIKAYDYCLDADLESVGLVKTATLIKERRAQAVKDQALTLLLDCGDGLQGTPMADYFAQDKSMDTQHPLLECFDALHYDAATLGNHDFNYGLPFLKRALKGAQTAFVCSNLGDNGTLPVVPHQILHRHIMGSDGGIHPLRIGILGLVPPQTMKWDRSLLDGHLVIHDMVLAGTRHARWLKDNGADIVVALAHTGIQGEDYTPMMENAALPLARVEDIDVIITGHTHLLLPGPHHANVAGVDVDLATLHGKPAVMMGWAGSHLGEIALDLEWNKDGTWSVLGHKTALFPITQTTKDGKVAHVVANDPEIEALIEASHTATRDYVHTPVGPIDRPLHSFFALLAPTDSLACVATAQGLAVRDELSKIGLDDLPILSAVSSHKTGGPASPNRFTDIPNGLLRLRHIADLQSYRNQINAIRTNGAHLRDWIEKSASVFNQIAKGATDQPLQNQQVPGYLFDVIYGLEYEVDLTAPARFDEQHRIEQRANRVTKLRWNGREVADSDQFYLAISDYRGNGGGYFPAFAEDKVILRSALSLHDEIARHIAAGLPRLWEDTQPWSFKTLGGTSVTYTTSARALDHLREIAMFAPEVISHNADHTITLRLHL